MNELMTMHAFEAATSTGRDHFARHNKIDDLSLYNHFGAVERVPLEAMVSTADDLVTPVKLKRFHGLMNSKTRQLLDVRPIGKTYALVNHGPVFEAQAKQLAASDLPLDNVEVLDRVYDAGARAHRTIIFHDLSKQTRTGLASLTSSAAGWISSTASICRGLSRYFPEPIATCAATLWSLVARRLTTSGRYTKARCRRTP